MRGGLGFKTWASVTWVTVESSYLENKMLQVNFIACTTFVELIKFRINSVSIVHILVTFCVHFQRRKISSIIVKVVKETMFLYGY